MHGRVTDRDRFDVSLGGDTVPAVLYPTGRGALDAPRLVLAHGAGAGQDHPFIVAAAAGLAERGVETTTFDFLYMAKKRRVPDPAPKLEACFRAVLAAVRQRSGGERPLFIGGKSMGGRMASHLAAAGEPGVAGLVFLGYPLHPPGKPQVMRKDHLPRITVPMLFVQGSRDAFGTPDELTPILEPLSSKTEVFSVEGGDHSFKVPKKKGGPSPSEVMGRVLDVVAAFVRR